MFLISNIFSFLFIIISEFLKDSINLSKHERLFLYILNIVTTSFIASSIFYYVQSYRPRKLIKKKSYLSIEPYLIKLNADLNIFNYWFDGKLYFDENGEIKLNTSLNGNPFVYSFVKCPSEIKPLFIQIKNKIIRIKSTGLSDNLDFELNRNLNAILIFIEDELESTFYSNKCLDSLYFGSFAKKSKIIIETYNYLDKYIKIKEKKYKNLKFDF